MTHRLPGVKLKKKKKESAQLRHQTVGRSIFSSVFFLIFRFYLKQKKKRDKRRRADIRILRLRSHNRASSLPKKRHPLLPWFCTISSSSHVMCRLLLEKRQSTMHNLIIASMATVLWFWSYAHLVLKVRSPTKWNPGDAEVTLNASLFYSRSIIMTVWTHGGRGLFTPVTVRAASSSVHIFFQPLTRLGAFREACVPRHVARSFYACVRAPGNVCRERDGAMTARRIASVIAVGRRARTHTHRKSRIQKRVVTSSPSPPWRRMGFLCGVPVRWSRLTVGQSPPPSPCFTPLPPAPSSLPRFFLSGQQLRHHGEGEGRDDRGRGAAGGWLHLRKEVNHGLIHATCRWWMRVLITMTVVVFSLDGANALFSLHRWMTGHAYMRDLDERRG